MQGFNKHVRYNTCIVYKILVGKSDIKRPVGGLNGRLEFDIKMDLKGIRCGDVSFAEEWGQRRALVNMVMHLLIP
jgi:hypothetical protein